MIKLIAAMDNNRCIGKNNTLPWSIPEDLQFFKKITESHKILMGRVTWESLPKRPLPKRTNIVVSRNEEFLLNLPKEVYSYRSVSMAILDQLSNSSNNEDIFIIGGASIYSYVLKYGLVDEMYLTKVHMTVEKGDCFFPPIFESDWNITTLVKAKSKVCDFTISHWKRKYSDFNILGF